MSILRANILNILIETHEWKTYFTVYKLVKKNYLKNKYIKIKIVFFKYSEGSIGEICSKRKISSKDCCFHELLHGVPDGEKPPVPVHQHHLDDGGLLDRGEDDSVGQAPHVHTVTLSHH